MNLNSSLERCYVILDLLSNPDCDTSIRGIAEKFSLPIAQVRLDYMYMLKSSLLRNLFLRSDGTSFIAALEEEDPALLETLDTDIKEGKYDTERFQIDTDRLGTDESTFFYPVFPDERPFLQKEFPSMLRSYPAMDLKIKKITSDLPADTADKLALVEQALQNHEALDLVDSETGRKIHIYPAGIFHDNEFNAVYIISANGKKFVSLSRITKDIHFSKATAQEQNDAQMIGDYMWGIGFNESYLPTKVKIRINNQGNMSNLIRKIKADILHRTYAVLTDCGDGTYLYEDLVIGMDSFRRWLRGYGSAMVVLEPEDLARKMYESACDMLSCYESGRFKYDETGKP